MSNCSSCNQPKSKCECQNGFTPAVIEITNPEELVLFRKVLVPVSMGDESQTPVAIGKYCNVLMVYEANGHAYLYSSDGIPSRIAFDSGGVLFVEEFPDVDKASVGFLYINKNGEAAITNDNVSWINLAGGGGGTNNFNLLTNRPKYAGVEMTGDTDIPDVTGDISSLSTEINSLSSSLSAETAARTSADTALQTNINTEKTERQTADDNLQTAINDEKTARQNADTQLQTNITNAISTLDAEIALDMNTLDQKITDEATARATADAGKVDKVAGKGLSTNDFTNADKDTLSTALQPDDINYTVMTDLKMKPTASTTSVVMEGDKVNLKEGTPSDFEIPLPVASSTQAGVMNTATYDTIQNNTAKINAIEGGAVAVTGISASPVQTDLTTAWQTATGQTTLINGASILDVDNDLRWTYYTNTSTWYSAPTGGTVTINPFTNTEAGTIKGSDIDGQVHAETDGTGSVKGWDTVKADIATHTSQIAAKVDKEAGKGLSTNDFTTAYKDKLDGVAAGAEVNAPLYSATGNATDGSMTQAATTNALDTKVDKVTGKQLSTNDFTDTLKTKLDGIEDGAQANRPIYTGTGQNTDGSMTQKSVTDALNTKQNTLATGIGIDSAEFASDKIEVDSTVALTDNNVVTTPVTNTIGTDQIADEAVTTAKIKDGAVTGEKIANNSIPGVKIDWDNSKLELVKANPSVSLPAASGEVAFITFTPADLEAIGLKNGDRVKIEATLSINRNGAYNHEVVSSVTGGSEVEGAIIGAYANSSTAWTETLPCMFIRGYTGGNISITVRNNGTGAVSLRGMATARKFVN